MSKEQKEYIESLDNLKCGNCGHDGGVAQLESQIVFEKQKASLELALQKAKELTSEDKKFRTWIRSCALVLSVLMVSATGYCIDESHLEANRAPIPAGVQTQSQIAKMYSDCLDQTANQSSGDRQSIVDKCNATFKDKIGSGISEVKSVEGSGL